MATEQRSALAASLADLGAAIQKERKQRGLTQTELAEISSTSINFISQIEQGKPTAQIGKVLEVLHALGLELSLGHGRSGIRVPKELRA